MSRKGVKGLVRRYVDPFRKYPTMTDAQRKELAPAHVGLEAEN
jgi:hypothetical protein